MHRDGELLIPNPAERTQAVLLYKQPFSNKKGFTVEEALVIRNTALIKAQQYYNRAHARGENDDPRAAIPDIMSTLNLSQKLFNFADDIEDCLSPDELPTYDESVEIEDHTTR